MNPGDLTTLANVRQWLALTGRPISAITQANPGSVTCTAHGFVSGATVGIDQVVGMTQVNGQSFTITVVDANTFTLGVDTSGYAAYVAGGYASLDDAMLGRLISAASTFVQSSINRTIRNLAYTDTLNGQNMSVLCFRNYPVTSVASLVIDGVTVPARPPLAPSVSNGAGYTFDATRLMLDGYVFTRGYQNVVVAYAAGFLVANEAQTIPASAPYTRTTSAHWSAGDRGVSYAAGGALTAVSGAPAAGQYSVAGSVYTFAAADAGKAVLISYGYVPFDLEQAVVDIIGEWFKYRDRIGYTSKSIEGQSVTFMNQAMSPRATAILNQYRRVAPIA